MLGLECYSALQCNGNKSSFEGSLTKLTPACIEGLPRGVILPVHMPSPSTVHLEEEEFFSAEEDPDTDTDSKYKCDAATQTDPFLDHDYCNIL